MNRAFALVRGYFVGACFVALQMYFLLRWLGVAADRTPRCVDPRGWRAWRRRAR